MEQQENQQNSFFPKTETVVPEGEVEIDIRDGKTVIRSDGRGRGTIVLNGRPMDHVQKVFVIIEVGKVDKIRVTSHTR